MYDVFMEGTPFGFQVSLIEARRVKAIYAKAWPQHHYYIRKVCNYHSN